MTPSPAACVVEQTTTEVADLAGLALFNVEMAARGTICTVLEMVSECEGTPPYMHCRTSKQCPAPTRPRKEFKVGVPETIRKAPKMCT